MPDKIWINREELAAKYPFYAETESALREVLHLAQLKGVTNPEITSMLATLHARAIARLHPNKRQREYTIDLFRQAVITFQNDGDA